MRGIVSVAGMTRIRGVRIGVAQGDALAPRAEPGFEVWPVEWRRRIGWRPRLDAPAGALAMPGAAP